MQKKRNLKTNTIWFLTLLLILSFAVITCSKKSSEGEQELQSKGGGIDTGNPIGVNARPIDKLGSVNEIAPSNSQNEMVAFNLITANNTPNSSSHSSFKLISGSDSPREIVLANGLHIIGAKINITAVKLKAPLEPTDDETKFLTQYLDLEKNILVDFNFPIEKQAEQMEAQLEQQEAQLEHQETQLKQQEAQLEQQQIQLEQQADQMEAQLEQQQMQLEQQAEQIEAHLEQQADQIERSAEQFENKIEQFMQQIENHMSTQQQHLQTTIDNFDTMFKQREYRLDKEQELDPSTKFVGPYVLDLLDNQLNPPLEKVMVRNGTYQRVEFRIERHLSENKNDPLFGNTFMLQGYFINSEGQKVLFSIVDYHTEVLRLTSKEGMTLTKDSEQHFRVAFDINTWFAGIDITGIDPQNGHIHIDSDQNAEVLKKLKDNMKQNVSLEQKADVQKDIFSEIGKGVLFEL